MAFDLAKFDHAQIEERVEKVPVPEFKMFFDDDEDPIWVVRALGGLEMAVARDAKEKNKNFQELVKKLLSTVTEEKVDALLETLGLAKQTPDSTAPEDYVWRVSCLHQGSVSPKIDETQAVRVALINSSIFYNLTNKILILSQMGKTLGE